VLRMKQVESWHRYGVKLAHDGICKLTPSHEFEGRGVFCVKMLVGDLNAARRVANNYYSPDNLFFLGPSPPS
jgi:hypothetical protein